VKIWIEQDVESGDCRMYDSKLFHTACGPIEISAELYERVLEYEREATTIQDILGSLVYDWIYPDDEVDEVDCA
jgi:hypothetical protein